MSINFELISEEEIPQKPRGRWPELFSKIPEGKAAVLTHDKVDMKRFANNIRSQLGQQKIHGRYKNLRISVEDDKVYIINRSLKNEAKLL